MAPDIRIAPSIRPAGAGDIAAVRDIYATYVETSTATFEETVPSLKEMHSRWSDIVDRRLPYLVIEDVGEIVGFAYAAPFRQRAGYRYTVEDSIYLRAGSTGRGLGRHLLAALIAECTVQNCRQMVAVIGDSGNTASIRLHRALGFRDVGVLIASGFKFARWIDSVYMQRPLGEASNSLPVG